MGLPIMNNGELLTILQEDIEYQCIKGDVQVHHGTAFLDGSTPDDICFYHLRNTDTALLQLREKLLFAQSGMMVFNIRPDIELNKSYLVINKKRWMEAQKKICDYFYPVHWEAKKMIGVTGTNGKTTTVHLALQVLQQIGEKGFSIGTLGVCDAQGKLADIRGMTTPPYIEFEENSLSIFSGL